MTKILCIESAENICSVCLSVGGEPQFLRESNKNCDHAAALAPFAARILGEAGITAYDLDAVAVSKGPGSYTGLRIGVAVAKGLCYAAQKPLIAAGTLDALAQLAAQNIADADITRICAVIDARRMEVYAALFDSRGSRLTDTAPVILNEDSFAQELERHTIVFAGSGADKCREAIRHPNARFMPLCASSAGLAALAHKRFEGRQFENIITFEPFYLKSFAATAARRGMLQI